jgi:ABC-type multidrug transport system ATPase subunit
MLAVAVITAPPVLLLDEAFADLDEAGTRAVDQFVQEWSAAGGVALCAAPSAKDAPRHDVLLELQEGRVATAI